MRYRLLGIGLLLLVSGCMPRTVVRQNPGPHDTGIRYYRPKPYLLVQPIPVAEGNAARHDKVVQISLEYLPDFSEEYSIEVRTGLGSNKTSIKLADGWNLTEINQDLDSNFDENVKAVGDLLKSVAPGGIVPTGAEKSRAATISVEATNVPIGYYESVIGRGPDCKKRLYGWRYVGFYPYSPCPLGASGTDCVDCHLTGVYGLVFHDGVMAFEIIQEVAEQTASSVKQVRTSVSHAATFSDEVLATLAGRVTEALNRQIVVPAEGFAVRVEESRPHLVFTFVTPAAEELSKILRAHRRDLDLTLETIIQEETGQTYSAVVRVLSEDSLPEPVPVGLVPTPALSSALF